MWFKLLGFVVWRAGKWFLRRKFGAAKAPKPLVAGGLALAVAGAILAARQASSGKSE